MKTPSLADYTVVVRPHDETWVAYVQAIPACHAIGNSPEEARQFLDEVFEMVIGYYREQGRTLPSNVRELIAVAG